MNAPRFYIRSEEEYYEFNLATCGNLIKEFKKTHFRKNSKHPARIYAKAFFPPDCPVEFWMYYLVFEVNGKLYKVTSITPEAFDTLTRGIEPTGYDSVEFYTIEKNEIMTAPKPEV